MQFIKTDIDGTGKKWRLAVLREQGTTFYFPEEDFEDLVENYEDCEKRPVPLSVMNDAAKILVKGSAICRHCGRPYLRDE